MSPTDDTGFLARWSARKRALQSLGPEDAANPVEADSSAQDQAGDVIDDLSDDEILEKLGLPAPETMKAGDDFTGFMANTVPARLRNRALRQLWTTNPVLANLDELLDYGEDFTDAATVVENLATAYRVGKGFLRREEIEELERERETDAAPATDESGEEAGSRVSELNDQPESVSEDEDCSRAAESLPEAPVTEYRTAVAPEPLETAVQRPRRMAFRQL